MIVCSHKFVILCGQKETVEPRRAQHMRNEKESYTVHHKRDKYFIYGTYVLLRILLRTLTHVIGPRGMYLDVSQFSARVEKLNISYCEPRFAFVRVRERHIIN